MSTQKRGELIQRRIIFSAQKNGGTEAQFHIRRRSMNLHVIVLFLHTEHFCQFLDWNGPKSLRTHKPPLSSAAILYPTLLLIVFPGHLAASSLCTSTFQVVPSPIKYCAYLFRLHCQDFLMTMRKTNKNSFIWAFSALVLPFLS